MITQLHDVSVPRQGKHNSQWPLGDSNPDAFRHKILNLACLPISPSGQFVVSNDNDLHSQS